MAGRGALPKPPSQRRRRNAVPEPTELVRDGRTRGPRLPNGVLPDGEDWHERTNAWWSTWRKSAQARSFEATDWDFLLDTALMHHVMWSKGRWEFAAEIRLRVAKFGATAEDRVRLRMEVGRPSSRQQPLSEGAGNVTSIDDRRRRLCAGEGGSA